MSRRLAFTCASLAALTVCAVGATSAASAPSSSSSGYQTLKSGMIVGFYDDGLVYGRTDWAFNQLKSLRAGIVRITINWPTVATRAPEGGGRSGRPRVQLDAVDHVIAAGGQQEGPHPRHDLRDAALGGRRQEPLPSR